MFAPFGEQMPGANPVWIDFDNDGDPDLVYGDTGAACYRNDGPSPGGGWTFTRLTSFAANLHSLAAADYDGDGR